jgi:uncharacterized membrane protein
MKVELTVGHLLDELIAQNLLHPDKKVPIATTLSTASEEVSTPWFVNSLIAIGAWLSVIPFLIFIALLDIIHSPISAILLGLLLIISTIFLHQVNKQGLFINHLALALNLTGQVLFIFGIAGEKHDIATTALATWFLELLLIGVYQNNILRFLSVLIATIAALVLLYDFEIHQGVHILIVLLAMGAVWYWIAEPEHLTDKMMACLYQPLGYGFVIALQMVLILSILPHSEFVPPLTWWYSSIGLTAVLLVLEYELLRGNDLPTNTVKNYTLFIGTFLIALLLHQSPGIIAAIIVLLLGYQRGNNVLIGLAIVFLSVFFIAYYYHLNISLLMKSITLMSAGVGLLVLRFVLQRIFPLSKRGD